MITQELLGYVRGEIRKGLTREEIHRTLMSQGGWSEDDISEVFRVVIPILSPAAYSPSPSLMESTPVVSPSPAPVESPSLIIPPSFSPPSQPTPSPQFSSIDSLYSSAPSHSFLWHNLIFVAAGLLCLVSWYFYKPQIIGSWNKGVESSQQFSYNAWNSLEKFSNDSSEALSNDWKGFSFPTLPNFNFKLLTLSLPAFRLPTFHLPTFSFQWPSFSLPSLPSFNFKWPSFSLPSFHLPSLSFKWPSFHLPAFSSGNNKTESSKVVAQNNLVTKNISLPAKNITKDCGTSASPKLGTPSAYENNPTLSCLGESALNCENAKGTLTDDFFPSIFEIIQSQGSCNFKLSYPPDSTLVDATKKKLAGQSVTCPLSIVKAIDNTNPASVRFTNPDKTNLSEYGSQIYLYGTLGLFIQNNLDQNKIQALGCSGDYINTMIASYNAKTK